jgi:hypothetical protein
VSARRQRVRNRFSARRARRRCFAQKGPATASVRTPAPASSVRTPHPTIPETGERADPSRAHTASHVKQFTTITDHQDSGPPDRPDPRFGMPQNGPISPETARNGPKRPKPVRIRTRSQPRQGVSSLNQSAIAASAKPKRRADDGSGIDDARDPAPTPAPGPAARAVSGPTSHASIRGFWSRPVFIWFLSGVHPDDRVLFGCIARGSDGTSSWRSPPCIHRIGTPNRSGTIFDRTARAGATHHTEPCIRAAARPLSRDAPILPGSFTRRVAYPISCHRSST